MAILSIYGTIVEHAVPFFFLSTGFLLAGRFDGSNDLIVIKKQIIKLLKMYVLWMALYTPLEIHHAWSIGRTPVMEVLYYVRGCFLVGEQYNSQPLWYLLSSIYGLSLICYLKKKGVSEKCIFVMMVDVGRYGFVKLQCYTPSYGFEEFDTYTDSNSLFEALWDEWLNLNVFLLAKEMQIDDIRYDEVFKGLSKEKQSELIGRKADFARMAGISL